MTSASSSTAFVAAAAGSGARAEETVCTVPVRHRGAGARTAGEPAGQRTRMRKRRMRAIRIVSLDCHRLRVSVWPRCRHRPLVPAPPKAPCRYVTGDYGTSSLRTGCLEPRGLCPLREDFQLADFIRTCLTRHNDVALNFCSRNSIVDRLLAGPMLSVKPRIDHQPPRAEQSSDNCPRCPLASPRYQPTSGQLLGIRRPPLRKSRQAAKYPFSPEQRNSGQLLLQSDLKVVPGDAS